MRVLVVSAFEASSQWAHAINTVKMAQGFARLGHQVTLLCLQPSSGGRVPLAELTATYGLTEPIRWVQLPSRIWRYPVGQHWRFTLLALPIALMIRPNLIFARNYIFPWVGSRLGFTTVAESHAHPGNKTAPFLRLVEATRHRAFKLWVTISQRLSEHYRSLGVPKEKLVVLPDAVDYSLFRRPERLDRSPYPNNGPNVVYVGHMADYKGIPTILEAAKRLPNVSFHLVGGWPEDVVRQQERAQALGLTNTTFHGLKPHLEIPPFLWHADVLLLPPSRYHPSALWTSPLKLGEYLASGTPIVASRIPALQSWVTDEEVEFVTPDDPRSLALGIQRILQDPSTARRRSQAGIKKAESLSFERRAESILLKLQLLNSKPLDA